MHAAIEAHRSAVAELCERFGVVRLEVFAVAGPGGGVSGSARSDCNFLVEMSADDGAPQASLAQRWVGFAQALEALLGHPVETLSPRSLRNPHFAAEVERTRRRLYERP